MNSPVVSIPNPRGSMSLFSTVLVFAVCLMAPLLGHAQPNNDSLLSEPSKVVETLTRQLLDVARNGQTQLKENPEDFYTDIESVLEPMVSFRYIAKNVMGPAYWNQADDAQKQAFLTVFKRSLVETYVKGMSQNLDYDIALLPDKSTVDSRVAKIVQKITSPEDATLIVYSLGLGKSGQWKVLNVVLDGVNLGSTFRGQFAQAMKDNGGNLDASIAGWAGKS